MPAKPPADMVEWTPPAGAVAVDSLAPEQLIELSDKKLVAAHQKLAETLSRTPPLGIGEHGAAQSIPDYDRPLLKAILAKQYAADQTMKKVGYGTRLATSFVQGAVDAVMPIAKRVGGPLKKLDPEQERFKQELLALRQGTDPTIRPDTNMLGRGVQQAAQMTFPMVQAVGAAKALRGAAQAAGLGKTAVAGATAVGTSGSFLPQTADQTYSSLIGEGVDPKVASRITMVSAPIEAAIESILPDPLSGYGAAFRGTARQVAGKLLREYTKNFTKELGEEALQRIVNETALEVGRRMDEHVPDQGLGNILLSGLQEMRDTALPLALLMGPGAVASTASNISASAERPGRLQLLKDIRGKGYVSAEDGKAAGIQGETRKERLANADAEIKQLEQEIQNATQVRANQGVPEEAGQVGQGGQGNRGGDVQQVPQAGPEASNEEISLSLGSSVTPPGDSGLFEPTPDGIPAAQEFLGDLASGQASLKELLNGLNGDRKRFVESAVRAAVSDREVLRRIISTVPVDVMNDLVGQEASPKALLDNPSVLVDALAIPPDGPVGPLVGRVIDELDALVRGNQSAAGLRGAAVGAVGTGAAGVPADIAAAIRAGGGVHADKNNASQQAEQWQGQDRERQAMLDALGAAEAAVPEQPKRDVAAEIRDALTQGAVTVSTPKVRSGFKISKVRDDGRVVTKHGKIITPDETWVINPPKPVPPPAVEQQAPAEVPAAKPEPVPPQAAVQPPVPETKPVTPPKSRGRKEQTVEPTQPPKRGEIGGKLAAGEVVLTSSGRPTTPFPSFNFDTNRKATNSVRKVDEWLLQNAIEEAKSRGDDYNHTIFSGETAKNLPQASKDSMEEYLFGEQPAVPKPILKPLAPPVPPQEPEAKAEPIPLPKGSVVGKRGQTAIPGMEEEATAAEARDEEQARWHPYKSQLVSRDIGVTEDAATEIMRGFSDKVRKHLSEDSDYNSTDIAELITEGLEFKRSGSRSTDSSRRDTATEMIEPAVAQAMADIAPTLQEAGGWKVGQNVETRYPTMLGKITGFEVVDGTLQARVQPSDGTDSTSVEMSDIIGEYTPEPEEQAAAEPEPQREPEKAIERPVEPPKPVEQPSSADDREIAPTDAPEVISFKGGRFVLSEKITPQQAAAGMEAIRENYKYRRDNEVEALKDQLSGEAIKSGREDEPQSIKDKRELYHKAISEQQDAEAERGRKQSDATKALERREKEIARNLGVPEGQSRGSLSKSKQHQSTIAQAKSLARKDPIVVEAERQLEHAKKVYETAKRHASEFKAELNKATSGERIPEGSVFVSKSKGASIAIRIGTYDEVSGTYEYENGTLASGKFYGHSYGGGHGDRGLTGSQIREGYGTVEESRSLRAVGLQALQAIEQAIEVRHKAEAEKQAAAEIQKARDSYTTEYKKPTVAQVMPLGSMIHATYEGKPAITEGHYAILLEDAPKGMQKRMSVDGIHGGRFSAERPVDIGKALPMKGKLPAQVQPAGFGTGDADVADHVFLTDGESFWKIDAKFYTYLSADGITFHGPEKQFEGATTENAFALARNGKRIGGIMPIGDEPGSLEALKKAVGDKFSMPEMPKKGKKTKLAEAADQAVQEAKDELEDFGKKLKGKGLASNPMFDPEVIAGAGRVVAKFVKAGTLKFAALIEQLAKSIGQSAVDRILPVLEAEWDKLQQSGDFPMEPRTPETQAEEPPPSADDLTSIKKEIVNDLRAQVGLPEMEGSTPQTVEEWAETARSALSADPKAAIRLVNELATNPRPISQHDAMLLQFRYRQLANELRPVADEYFAAVESKDPVAIATARSALANARSAMTQFEEVIHPSKETWGRTGVALQQLLRRDFSLEAILRRGQEANDGEELSPEQTAELTGLAKQYETLQKQLEEQQRKTEALEAELASKRQHEEAVVEVKKEKVHRKSDRRQAAEKKVADAWEKFRQAAATQAGAGPHLLGPAIDVAKAYVELGYVRFGEFMAAVRKNAPDADEKLFRQAWDQAAADGGVEVSKLDPLDRAELTKEARQIQRTLVENGMTDRDQVIDAVHEMLKQELPDLTRRQTMDALSRYGQFQRQSQDEIEKLLRGMNTEILKLSQIDQMEIAMRRVDELRAEGKSDEEIGKILADERLLVEATGLVRDRPGQTVRQLTAKYNELKKAIPPTPAGKAGLLQTALNQIERALRNRISDLRFEIQRGEKVVKEKRERPTSDQIKALEEERDALAKIHKEMFPPPKRTMTEAQRIASAIRGADMAIARLEKQLEVRDFDTEKRAPVSSPELRARRARLEQLRAARKAAKELELARMEGEGGAPAGKRPLSDAEIARKAYEASLRKRIADYEQLLADGDFSPKPKKGPRTLSESELQLKRKMEDVRHAVLQKYADYHLAHLKGIAWTADKIAESAHLSRALITSFDMSALMRQGGLVALGHPGMAKDALAETIGSIAHTFDKSKVFNKDSKWSELEQYLTGIDSRQAEFNFMHKLTSGPAGELRQQAGLNLPSTDQAITRQEEAFQGRWGKLFPGIAISSRLYTMILNKLRADLFDAMVQNLGRGGQVTMDQAKLLASFVNVATGRSDLKMFNRAAATLNTVFFAPRYVASRFQYLAMPFYLPFQGGLKANWRVKRAIYQEYGRTATGIATVLGAFALLGRLLWDDDDEDRPQVETDARSSDFLKVRIGETRLDFLAGLSQVMVLSSRMALGQTKSSVTGKVREFGEGYNPQTRASVMLQFARTKLAPVPGAVTTIADQWTNVVGQPEPPLSLVMSAVLPLSLRDAKTTMETQGIPAGTAMSVLSVLGVGMNTYGPKTQYITGTPEERAAQVAEDLKRVAWDSPPPAYSEFLSEEQLSQFESRRQNRRGLVVFNSTYPGDNEQEIETRGKNREYLKSMGLSFEEAWQLLTEYHRPKDQGKRYRELKRIYAE